MKEEVFNAKSKPLTGTAWSEVAPQARQLFRRIEKRTRRRPYIRSAYFRKDKIFLSHFWRHLSQKPYPEQLRRMKYLPCALELVQKSRYQPTIRQNPNRRAENLYRFAGRTPAGRLFMVQIKEHQRTGKKELMSVFPYK